METVNSSQNKAAKLLDVSEKSIIAQVNSNCIRLVELCILVSEVLSAQSLWEIIPPLPLTAKNESLMEAQVLSDKDKRDCSRYHKDGRKRHRLYSEMRNRISISVSGMKVTTA